MPVRKIAISLPESVLNQVDVIVEERGTTRSGYIAKILTIAMSARNDADVTKKINEFFEKNPDLHEEEKRVPRLMKHHRSTRGTSW